MPYQLVAFDKLATSIRTSINTLLEHHRFDVNKQEESIQKLDSARRIHVQLLNTTLSLLETNPPLNKEEKVDKEEKARVLNAIAHYICEQIDKSYKRTKNTSKLYFLLETSLEINKEYKPNKEDLYDMYDALKRFLSNNVYNEGKPTKGYLSVQAFSSEKIKDYSIEAELKELESRVSGLKLELIDFAKEKYEKQVSAKTPARKGLFGSLWSGAPAKEDSHTPAAGATL